MDLFIFPHSGERIQNFRIRYRIRRLQLGGSPFRKEKVADSKMSGYAWTGLNKVAHLHYTITSLDNFAH